VVLRFTSRVCEFRKVNRNIKLQFDIELYFKLEFLSKKIYDKINYNKIALKIEKYNVY